MMSHHYASITYDIIPDDLKSYDICYINESVYIDTHTYKMIRSMVQASIPPTVSVPLRGPTGRVEDGSSHHRSNSIMS